MTGIYPCFIHSIPQLVRCFATDLRHFRRPFLITCFIKLPKYTFLTESISSARIPTWLHALPTWKTANPIPSAETVIAISCAGGIWKKDEQTRIFKFQSADFTKVFFTFYSTSLAWSRKRFRVSIENVSGISKEGAVTVISISVLLPAVRVANRLKACRATTVSCWEKQTLQHWKEEASAVHRPCLGELIVPALTHLLIMLESSCSHLCIWIPLAWRPQPRRESNTRQEISYCGNGKWGGSQLTKFSFCVQHLTSWKIQWSELYTTPTIEKDTDESNNIATF